MKTIREICVAGRTIMYALRAVTNKCEKGQKRKKKINPSKDAVREVNQRNAVKLLTMKLNHNFKFGDLHITLTYAGEEPDREKAKHDKKLFLRKLAYRLKKQGKELKRIDVTEYLNHRIHHHMVINQCDINLINELWEHGHVKVSMLDETGDYRRLAEYLIKETSKTFRSDSNPNKRRYNCSRNVVTPEIKREIVSARELTKDLKPFKGYYIDEDSIRRYEHAFTGAECLECTMISLDEKPRLKRWNKGKKCKIKHYAENNAYAEEQIEIEVM